MKIVFDRVAAELMIVNPIDFSSFKLLKLGYQWDVELIHPHGCSFKFVYNAPKGAAMRIYTTPDGCGTYQYYLNDDSDIEEIASTEMLEVVLPPDGRIEDGPIRLQL